jgi:hypothetical protein
MASNTTQEVQLQQMQERLKLAEQEIKRLKQEHTREMVAEKIARSREMEQKQKDMEEKKKLERRWQETLAREKEDAKNYENYLRERRERVKTYWDNFYATNDSSH